MNIRHGDLALIGIEKLPAGLTASDSKVLMRGSGGNDHTFTKGVFYPRKEAGQFIFGYFEALPGCLLLHPDHGAETKSGPRKAEIPAGLYELRRQVEDTNEGMKPIVD